MNPLGKKWWYTSSCGQMEHYNNKKKGKPTLKLWTQENSEFSVCPDTILTYFVLI